MAKPTLQQALEQLAAQAPFRKRHLQLFLLSIGGTFMDGYATLIAGVALALFKLQEHPDPFLVGLLGAALVMGAVAGAILGGYLGDQRGRRFVYRLDMASLAVGQQAGEQRQGNTSWPAAVRKGWSQLLSASQRRTTAITAGSWFLTDIATYGVGLFTPIILAALLGTSSQASAAAASVITGEFHTIAGTGLVDTFLLVGFVVGILLVPRFGPIRMQSIGSPCRRRVLTGSGWCSWASSCLTC